MLTLTEKIKFCWTFCPDAGFKGEWVTDCSDLDANLGNQRNYCPCCHSRFTHKHNFVRIIYHGSDNEIGAWQYKCPTCNSILTIVND